MIIQDHTKALLSYLEDEYKEQEQQLLAIAKEEAEKIILVQKERANVVAERRKERELKATRQRIHAATAAASYAAKQAQDILKEAYLKKGLQLIKKQLENISQKQKELFIKKLLDELKATITKEGYDKKTFTYDVWHGVSITGTKKTLPSLSVHASKEYISFEDSMEQRLEEQESVIKQELLKNI